MNASVTSNFSSHDPNKTSASPTTSSSSSHSSTTSAVGLSSPSFSTSDEWVDDTWTDPRGVGENATISFLFSFIMLTALVGNILVVLAVFLYYRLRDEVSNLFIVNLSITDLSSAVVIMVSSAVAVGADRWPFGSVWCSMVCGANYCFIIVSMLTLCFISLDRHVAINHSLRYHVLVTRRRVLALVAYTWLQGFSFGLAPVICGWVEYDYWEATCAIQWHRYGNPVLIYVIVAFVLCFLLPGVVLAAAYCRVFRTATKIKPRPRPAIHMVNLPQTQPANQGQQARNNNHATEGRTHNHSGSGGGGGGGGGVAPGGQRWPGQATKYSESSKALRSLLIVVLAYFICMTPFSVTKLYKVCVPVPDALPGFANLTATFFQYLGSAVNPLIYGIFRRDFQKAFLYLLWRSMRTRNPGSTSVFASSGSSM